MFGHMVNTKLYGKSHESVSAFLPISAINDTQNKHEGHKPLMALPIWSPTLFIRNFS